MPQTAISHSDATAYVAKHFAATQDAIEILYAADYEEPDAVDVFFSLRGNTYRMTVWHEPGIGLYGEW